MANKKTGRKKKLPWTSMEITKVKLNPEQAVLACCDSVSRLGFAAPNHCAVGCGGSGAEADSS